MPIIIGIDPGSRCTGYGIIEQIGSNQKYIIHGQITTQANDTAQRLVQIFTELSDVINTYRPDEAAIEQVFMHINVQAALKLGQARGVALLALAQFGMSINEYSPRQIKQAIVGYGAAEKTQVQHMVRYLLQLPHTPPADAADALAIALCHCQCQQMQRKLQQIKS